jgi:PncC family amidohydrolase
LQDEVMHSRRTLICHSIINLLRQRGQSLGVAESCTGGLISEWLTRVSGASDVFKGGIIAYTDDVKARLLGVDKSLIAQHGSVSEIVAKELAMQAQKVLQVDFALSTTGFAGPTGGTTDAPVGTVYVGVSSVSGTLSVKHYFAGKPRQSVRELASMQALLMLERQLQSSEGDRSCES